MEWTNLKFFLSDIMAEKLIASMIIQWGIVGLFFLFDYIAKVKSEKWERYIEIGAALIITSVFVIFLLGHVIADINQFVRSCIF